MGLGEARFHKEWLLPGAVAVGAAAAMTGDLVFGILPDEWAVVGWTSAAVLVGGLTFTVQRYYNKTRTVAAINTPSIDHFRPHTIS